MLIRCQVPGMTSQWLPVSLLHQHTAPAVNDKLGHFEKVFVEIDKIDSGEFGGNGLLDNVLAAMQFKGPGSK